MCDFMQCMSPLLCANIVLWSLYQYRKIWAPLKEKFWRAFLPGLGVKTPTLLVTDFITMATSIAFVVTFICFVFHKAWIYHSIASETFLFLYKSFENCPFYCACEFTVIISCFSGKKQKSLLKLLNSLQVLSKIK